MRANLKDLLVIVGSLFVAAAIVFLPRAFTGEPFNISFISGSPDIMKAGSADWDDCREGMAVGTGDRIRTAAGEVVEISFGSAESNTVKVSESSDVFLRSVEEPRSIELLNGEVMALLRKMAPKSTFEVRTPAGLSGARGTGWGSRTDGKTAEFSSYENSIYARGIDRSGNPMDGELIVGEGFRTTVNLFESPSRLEAIPGRDMAGFREWRNEIASRSGGSLSDKFDRIDSMTRSPDAVIDRADDQSEAMDAQKIEEKIGSRPDYKTSGNET